MPPGSVAGFNASVGLTVNVKAREPVAPLPSVAVTVKLLVPAALGDPVMSPVEALSVRPAGRLPELMLNV